MKTAIELRERRTHLAALARTLLDSTKGKDWTAENQVEYDGLTNEISGIDQQLTNLQRLADIEAGKWADEEITDQAIRMAAGVGKEVQNAKELFTKFLRNGWDGLTREEIMTVRNTMSTTTGSEGGYTVPSLISGDLVQALKAYGAMRNLATVLKTADGKPLSFPSSDGTSETGEWIAQNTTATGADPTFGTVSLNVFKASSKIVAVPFELLQDSVVNIDAFVASRLAERLGRICNTGFTVGTGTTQPDGVVPKATSGKVGTTGQTATIIYDDVVDLVHSIDPAYRSSACAFMGSDGIVKVLRKLKDGSSRPIWTPNDLFGISKGVNASGDGGYSSPNTAVPFDTLLGYPLYVNNDMASPAANAKSLVFGDFSKYVIRDAMDIQLFRFTDSAYTKLGQVGFLAWMRTGGNLLDTAAVKYYAHSAT